MFAEVESDKSRNVIIVCVCCPEENYIAHKWHINKVLVLFHLTQMLLLKFIGTNKTTHKWSQQAYMQQVNN